MACHHKNSHHKLDLEDSSKKLVLVGNPNVGKSIFFNYLTGIYVAVSNYPGTTLDITKGRYQDFTVLDTPGVYGVSSFNDEEIVARDVIMAADIVVNVVDAVHLERDLFLTQQIIDMGIPVIIALNMMDEAEKNGLSIDIDRLSSELGVPVIPTTAVSGKGLSELKASLNRARVGESIFEKHNELTEKLAKMNEETTSTRDALLILEGDPHLADRYRLKPMNFREEIYRIRRKRVDQIIDNVVSDLNDGKGVKATLSRMMVNPVTGVPLLLITLYILYQLIGVFIAQTVVGLTEEAFFLEIYEPFIRNLVSRVIPAASFTSKLLIGEFGILTMAVTYVFGLLLPLVIGFYFFLSILEDSGYMPRIAALVDRTLTSLGLNGRAIIPMLLGFGCVTMATITTRLLGSKRERIIAIFLLGLAIPCSAQLGVIVGLISPLGVKYFLIYVFVLLLVYVLSGTFLNKVLPGKSTDLLIDLPPLRIPRIGNVLNKTRIKSFAFIKEAGPIFVLGAVIITVLQETGILIYIQELVAPITIGWLRLPPEVATAFVMGIIRRDFGAAGLNSLAMTPSQTTVALITITLFVPCIAAMMIMVKERNWKEATAIWFGSWFTAFIVGGLVALFI
ncbi:ferrous iron transport protein B [Iocasia frigidifontis]|uniref:Ferrous iron transport protein B n=1 Tax=Iocasia fonsfrigidae TaxID=2682810 RepID=A0A8A7K8D5_9FIRM|nr:ferrous iron transport protein B [Iocasia fonsfrigidae]QTL97721.1 ferrous iron transport protein B [Iocasia fonsfrigidae]